MSDKETEVSRSHARVFRTGNTWHLEDTDSKKGTWLNRRKIESKQPFALKHGDVIRIDPYTLKFESDEILYDDDSRSSIEGSLSGSGFGSVSIRPEDKLDGILKINAALAGNVDFRAICPRVLKTLFEIFPQTDRGAILLFQGDSKQPTQVAKQHRNSDSCDSILISHAILNHVLATNLAVISANTLDDPRMKNSDSVLAQNIHSTMCAPMHGLDGQPFGVIYLDSLNPRHRFSQEDLQLLVAVASQASHAFENARLLTISVTEKVQKEKRDEEMKISFQVQRALIPATLPQVPGYQFFGSYDAAEAVGGDYFDCFAISKGKICVSIGDVMGKGVPAALMMSRLSGIVRSIMHYTDDVCLAMSQINDLMCSDSEEVRFVTHLLGVVDPAAHTFTFANAGHMPPEIRSGTGDLTNPGTANSSGPIGIDKGLSCCVLTIPLAPGTSVILRTDGVDDAMSASGDPFGVDRLRSLLQRELADPETLGRVLLADVRAHVAGHKQHDDITIMTFGRLA